MVSADNQNNPRDHLGQEMTFKISKTFRFSASHSIPSLPEGHKCKRLHGHTYHVELIFEGKLDEHGFVIDYGDLDVFLHWLKENLDHRHLNDILPGTSAEQIAKYIYENCGFDLNGVKVSESPDTWAEYTP